MDRYCDAEEKIAAVLDWAETEKPEGFDTSFVYSLAESLEHFGHLTEGQKAALEDIIKSWKINVS